METKPTYEELEQRVKKLEKKEARRKQAEEELLREKLLSDSIVDNTPAGIAFLDNDFVLRRCNHVYAELIQLYSPYTPEQAIGSSYFDYVPGSRPQVEDWFQKVRDTGKADTRHGFKLVIERDGKEEISYWDASIAPVLDPDGKTNGILILTQDVTHSKLAEEVLRESEEKFRLISETSPDYIYQVDRDGIINYCSPAVERILDYKPEELIGTNFINLIPPNSLSEMSQNFQTMVSQNRTGVFELQFVKKSGGIANVETHAATMIKEGKIVGVQGITRDITERKQAEQALRESEEKYRHLVDHAPTGFYEIDFLSDKFISVNDAMISFSGYSKEELLSMKTSSILTDASKQIFFDRIKRASEGEKVPETVELEIIIKDGTTRWASLSTSYKYENKELIGASVIAHDITDRKRAEEALRESEEKYRLLADNVTDVIWVRDMNLRPTYVSPSITNQTGYTIEETMAKTLEETLAPDSLKLAVEVFTEELEIEKHEQKDLFRSRTIQLEINCKDGSTIWTEVKMSFLRDQLGNPTGVIGVSRDITNRKQLEAQLQQAQRMETIGTLAGGVAHDLNNILSGIVSYPELILMDLPEGSHLKKPILTIQKSGEKAAVIVQDLLTLARRGVSITDVLDLNHIISEQLKSPEFEKLISFHPDVQVKTTLEKDLLNIKGSPTHLSKSVMNILSNAAEAMPGGGTILISTENRYLDRSIKGYNHVESGEYVIISFTDTGMGIPEEDAKRIFEPFYTKKVMGRSGTGLGMSVVWGTVKDHKGYIDIQSTVGKGTTCTLYFPVTRKEIAKDESLMPIADYMGKGELILVVDDVEEQREIATGMLRKLGYTVTSISSGEEAVEYLKTNSADLIVLDMIMDPGINGRETYERIKKYHPNQKAIIASGFSETEDVKAAKILGVGEYIKKPYTLEKIGIAVRDELKK